MIGLLQGWLDRYLEENPGEIDYVHGDDAARTLGSQENALAFFMPAMDKSDLFQTVIASGVFPRKSFSIGHAVEKRYYLECRVIQK